MKARARLCVMCPASCLIWLAVATVPLAAARGQDTQITGRITGSGALCFAPIRNSGSLNLASLLEFQKWGVEQGHQIRLLSETEVSDLEFVRKAAADLDSEAPAR